MSRRFQNIDPSAQDRWMVSYADFVTLLFAFFVVLYSISSVNQGKYEMLSGSLSQAFDTQQRTFDEINPLATAALGSLIEADFTAAGENTDLTGEIPQKLENPVAQTGLSYEDMVEDRYSEEALDAAEREIDQLGSVVEQQVPELIDEDLVDVRRNKFWLEVEIKSNLLFPSGSSELLEGAVPVLQEISRSFLGIPNRLNIEGFTDNEPISTSVFPSNWELSAARAATVVRLFEEQGIEPARMASIGYGEHKPVAGNDTLEGRARNRRVVIVVMADMDAAPDQRLYRLDLAGAQ